jgi:hypothetical protein
LNLIQLPNLIINIVIIIRIIKVGPSKKVPNEGPKRIRPAKKTGAFISLLPIF